MKISPHQTCHLLDLKIGLRIGQEGRYVQFFDGKIGLVATAFLVKICFGLKGASVFKIKFHTCILDFILVETDVRNEESKIFQHIGMVNVFIREGQVSLLHPQVFEKIGKSFRWFSLLFRFGF